jgi:hypothetical protein
MVSGHVAAKLMSNVILLEYSPLYLYFEAYACITGRVGFGGPLNRNHFTY